MSRARQVADFGNVTSTAAELNLIDGGTARGTTAFGAGDGVVTNDGGTMRMTNIDTLDTYYSATSKTLTNKTITNPAGMDKNDVGLGNVDNVADASQTTLGTVTSGVLNVGVTGGSGLTAIAGVTTGSGNVTITDGNLILDAGNGIDFSDTADSSATGASTTSELLDDYEEGTFTPVCTNVGFSGSSGNYTKIGNSVHVSMNGAWATSGTPTNISGLPFTLSSRACMGVIAMNRVDTVSVAPFAYCPGTQTYFYIWSVHDNTYWGDAISTVSNVGEITMTVTYQV